MRAIAVIAGKDLRQQARNGTLLLFAVGLPLLLGFLFNVILGDPGGQFSATYAVADEDRSHLSEAFVEDVLGAVAASTEGDIELRPVASPQEGARLVEEQDVSAVFVIPAGFAADVEAGRAATLRVIGNVDAAIATAVARGIAEAYATELRSVQLAVALTAGVPGADPDEEADPDELVARVQALPAPVTVDAEPAADRVLDSSTYYAAGMAVFFLFFTAMLSLSSILRERTDGTMARLLATPTPRPAILVGKLAAGVGIGVAAMAVLVGASTLLLGARWGDPLGVAALVVAVVLAATGLMALVTTFASTVEQASGWMSVIGVLFGLFGGSFVPLAQLGTLSAISYATPHRWFLQGLSDLGGGELSAVVVPVAALLGFAAVGFGLALLRLGRVVRP